MLSSVLMDDDEVKHDEQDEDDLEASSAPSRSKNEQKRKKKKKVKKGESKTNEDDADGGVGDDPFDDLDDILAEFNPNKCKYALLLISFLHFPCLFHLSPPPPHPIFCSHWCLRVPWLYADQNLQGDSAYVHALLVFVLQGELLRYSPQPTAPWVSE